MDGSHLKSQEYLDKINLWSQKYRETKHLSTDADSSTDTKKILLRRQVSPPPKKKKEKRKKMCCDFTPFMSKSFQIWDNFFPLVFPKDSKNLKRLDIGLQDVGAKRCLNGPIFSLTFPQGFQKSKKFANWTLWSGGKRPLKGVSNTDAEKILFSKAKFAQKLTFFALRFYTLYS